MIMHSTEVSADTLLFLGPQRNLSASPLQNLNISVCFGSKMSNTSLQERSLASIPMMSRPSRISEGISHVFSTTRKGRHMEIYTELERKMESQNPAWKDDTITGPAKAKHWVDWVTVKRNFINIKKWRQLEIIWWHYTTRTMIQCICKALLNVHSCSLSHLSN